MSYVIKIPVVILPLVWYGSSLNAQDRVLSQAALTGCYEIELLGWYEPPMTKERGPYATKPAGYKGIPERVRVSASENGVLEVTTLAPDSVATRWSVEVRGDSLHLGWPRSRFVWGLLYSVARSGDSLEGVTWYWSHVLRGRDYEPKRVPTRWHRIDCEPPNQSVRPATGMETRLPADSTRIAPLKRTLPREYRLTPRRT